jgi:hypothetical protein
LPLTCWWKWRVMVSLTSRRSSTMPTDWLANATFFCECIFTW